MKAWKAFFAGDIVIQKPVISDFLCDDLIEIIKAHNIVSCNFEAPLLAKNSYPIPKAGPNIFQCEQAAKIVVISGFNLISLANNHIADYGKDNIKFTIDSFVGVTVVGAGMTYAECYGEKIIEIEGIKVGFLSFAEWGFGSTEDKGPGFAWINHPSVNNIILRLKDTVDVLILQVHAGAEEVDIPLPEWRVRYRELIDLGADIIIGHHPHVPQGWERYKKGYIFYSLGNFYFDIDNTDIQWNRGYAVSLSFIGSSVESYEVIPIEKTVDGVTICRDKEYKNHLEYLCKMLSDSNNYMELANQQALLLWNERYKYYYLDALNGISNDSTIRKIAKVLIKRIIKRGKINNLLLLHNIKIETHRYAVERALSLLEGKRGEEL